MSLKEDSLLSSNCLNLLNKRSVWTVTWSRAIIRENISTFSNQTLTQYKWSTRLHSILMRTLLDYLLCIYLVVKKDGSLLRCLRQEQQRINWTVRSFTLWPKDHSKLAENGKEKESILINRHSLMKTYNVQMSRSLKKQLWCGYLNQIFFRYLIALKDKL